METVLHSENEMQMEGKAVRMAPVTTGGFWKSFQDFRSNYVKSWVFII